MTKRNAAGFEIDTLGRVVTGSTVTGPTDLESPFAGRVVTLTAVRFDEVLRGQVIGGFAQWVQGGPQPLNLLSALMVCAVVMKPVWDRHIYRGQKVIVERDGCSFLSVGSGGDLLYEVTWP